jgi:hypothetical protein
MARTWCAFSDEFVIVLNGLECVTTLFLSSSSTHFVDRLIFVDSSVSAGMVAKLKQCHRYLSLGLLVLLILPVSKSRARIDKLHS